MRVWMWFVLSLSAVAWAAQWAAYCNPRFGFCVQRPAFMAPQPPPQNGDGREFRAGQARMLAYGGNRVLSLTETYAIAQKDLRVTYRALRAGSFVVSGYKGRNVVYQHTRVMGDAYVSVYLEYPQGERKTYDPLIKPIVDSIKPVR